MQGKKTAKKNIIAEQKSKISTPQGTIPAKPKCRHSIWKYISIGVVAIFVLFVIGGLVKVNHFRSSIARPTQEQIDYSKAIAIETLQSMGINTSGYEIRVAENMRKIPFDGDSQSIIQVSLYKNTTTHTYLIDLDSKEVILHSQTDVYREIGIPKHPGCGKDDAKCAKGGGKGDRDSEFNSPWFRGFFGRG